MSSVTQRIKKIKQPRGGYIKPSQFKLQKIDDGKILNEQENIHASVIGMAVDYLTADTIWDFKVSKSKLTNKHTLQLLMYWIMGQHSGQEIYKNIKKLGIFNPRLNSIYTLNIDNIAFEIIEEIEKHVICY